MKVLTVIGARPQFIKAAAVSRIIREEYAAEVEQVVVHTGQHFDANMSAIFFEQLGIPQPDRNLGISGGGHGAMTGRILSALEEVLVEEQPDTVLVYGDTNSTLAAALAAAKLHIPVAHVEAGLRSFNMRMPEEINRVLTDRISSALFCPTLAAIRNLEMEGMRENIHHVGDVMYDMALLFSKWTRENSTAVEDMGLAQRGFALATCHREENTNSPGNLREILAGLGGVAERLTVVLPLHPRTRKLVEAHGLAHMLAPLAVVDPLPFFTMVALEQAAALILTDSGGVQKEAFFYGVPCVTMREQTEWVETVELGRNTLTGASAERIIQAAENAPPPLETVTDSPYGEGDAARKIIKALVDSFHSTKPRAAAAHEPG